MLFLEILALLYVTSAFVTLVFAVCKLSLNVASEATLKSVSLVCRTEQKKLNL